MAQVPASRLGEQIVPAGLKSLLVTPVVTDHHGSQAAMWAFFCHMLKYSCALKGAGPPRFPAPVVLPVEEHGRCSGGSPGLALTWPHCSLMYSSFLMVFILLISVPLSANEGILWGGGSADTGRGAGFQE